MDCKHPRVELRWFTAANGARHLRPQCLDCGKDPHGFRAVPKANAKGDEKEWDNSIQESLDWVSGDDTIYDDRGELLPSDDELPWE